MSRKTKSQAANHVLMTPSEVRAEAAYMIVEAILGRINASERMRIMGAVKAQLHGAGLDRIEAEVDALFVEFPPTRPVE